MTKGISDIDYEPGIILAQIDKIKSLEQRIAELETELSICHRIIFPCKKCGGLGQSDDAEPGDISFNIWLCPICDGFNIEEAKQIIRKQNDE